MKYKRKITNAGKKWLLWQRILKNIKPVKYKTIILTDEEKIKYLRQV